jgi:hypothetical protein
MPDALTLMGRVIATPATAVAANTLQPMTRTAAPTGPTSPWTSPTWAGAGWPRPCCWPGSTGGPSPSAEPGVVHAVVRVSFGIPSPRWYRARAGRRAAGTWWVAWRAAVITSRVWWRAA